MRTADPSKAPRILDSAAQLFAERPYHEVRMDDIAARAGVAKGTLYLHFRDKEALYLGLIEDGMRRQFCEILSRVAEVDDPFDQFRYVAHAAVAFFDAFPYFLQLIPSLDAKLPADPSIPLRARKAEFLALLATIFAAIDASGRLPVPDPGFSSLAFIGLLHEILKSTPRPWPGSIAERIGENILYGVRGRPA